MKVNSFAPAAIVCLLFYSAVHSQKAQFPKERFQPVKTTAVAFTPYSISDFSKTDKSKTVKNLITLPNKKQVTLEQYLKTVNHVEKNLSAIGISRDRTEQTVIVSKYKPVSLNLLQSAITSTTLSKTTLTSRFGLASMPISQKTLELDKIKQDLSKILIPDADKLPNEPFSNESNFDIPKFKVADYGVDVNASYKQKGVLDPFSISGNRLHLDSLKRLIKNTNNEFTIAFNVNITADVPQLGDFPIYKLESEFTAKANKDQKHVRKARFQVLDLLLVDDVSPLSSGDTYSYTKTSLFNSRKKLGAADIFSYGLNVLLPVDMYLLSTGFGANFDVDIARTGVGGTITPIITQSIILETSASEMTGIISDLLNFDILDAGVGGELRLVEGGLDFGGNAGLTITGGGLKFVNDTYTAASLNFLRGRLYTFYVYPKYICDNIFGLLTPSCWVTRRVENDFFDSGSFIKFQKILLDEFKGRNLTWK